MRVLSILTLILLLAACQKVTPKKLQELLVGEWHGNGGPFYGAATWQADFAFETNGHYTGTVTTGPAAGVFEEAFDTIDHPERKFVIHYTDTDKKAYGEVNVVTPEYELTEFRVSDIVFSNENDHLDFVVTAQYTDVFYSLDRK